MVCIISLAAIVLIGATSLTAADEPAKVAKPTTAVLQARLDGKKAAVRMAEVDVRAAKAKLARLEYLVDPSRPALALASTYGIEDAKLAVEKLEAHLDMRKAEVREVTAQLDEQKKGSAPQAGGPVTYAGQAFGNFAAPAANLPMPTLVPASIPAAAPPQAAKVAAFDMTAVRREFKGSKYRSYLFEKKKREVLAALEKLRKKQASLKTSLAAEIDVDARRELARQIEKLGNIETEEVRIKKMFDKEAAKLEEACYNEIKMVVEKMAEMNGYDIVLAYPGPEKASDAEVGSIGTGVYHFRANAKRAANSNEENAHLANTRHLRLQLHPPAAQPFHIAKKVETTGVVVQTLNTWYPPKDATGQPVNVDLLPELP